MLIACEFSQVVCKAFRDNGHEAYSCDLLPTEGNPKWHIQDNVLKHLDDGWDLMVAHPPCTYLSYVGNRHWNKPGRAGKRIEAMQFFMNLVNAPIKKICVENPLGYPCQFYRSPDQIIHPYYFGERVYKRTCLWLKNLSPLWYWRYDDLFGKQTMTPKPQPLYISNGQKTKGKKINWVEGIKNKKSKERSRTFLSIAEAMATQWGKT